nr:hypothetical protein [Tanacetum cinerariifolium]
MATTIEQQTVLDESLVPSTQRLRIGRSNFRLPSDIQSKEATLQVVYDVLRNSPLFRAFQVTADVPEIYMQEFWATAKLHHNSIRVKIDTRKSVLDLEAFREMLHINPRISNQPFADLPTEEEILDFLRFLGHSHDIRYLTDVNVNKLYQPWRSFAAVINKCLTGKSSGVDSFRLSQAQMIWGFYHIINIDFAYLIWEDFVYQVEHKSQKRSNEINYPRFTKVIIDYFMTRKPSISRRNRINWHYVRDDALFSTIKVVSRHQTTQQYGAILPIELTTTEIRNSKAYKEYHACAIGEAAPKPKASARKRKGDFASSTTPPTPSPTTTVESAPRLSATAKGKQPSRATTPVEPTDVSHRVPDVSSDDSEEELSWKYSDDEDVGSHDEGKKSDESDDDRDEGTFRFEERLRSLETSFSEYRQTNQFADAVSAIPGIVHQYMDQQMKKAVREAVQIQTNRLQDSLQKENDEFLRNTDKNIKKVLKGLVKNQVKEQVSRILPRIE